MIAVKGLHDRATGNATARCLGGTQQEGICC